MAYDCVAEVGGSPRKLICNLLISFCGSLCGSLSETADVRWQRFDIAMRRFCGGCVRVCPPRPPSALAHAREARRSEGRDVRGAPPLTSPLAS